MSTSDQHDRPSPSWPPALPSAAGPPQPQPQPLMPAPVLPSWEEPLAAEAPAEPPRALGPRTVLRAAKRYWWQILLLWVVGSGAALFLIHTKVKPSYESYALLEVDAPAPETFGPSPTGDNSTTSISLMETQAQLITTNDVLGAALQIEKVANLPRVRQALDPKAELRAQLRTTIMPNSKLITVSMSSNHPNEAADIINSVIDEYINYISTRSKQQSTDLKRELDSLSKDLELEVRKRKAELLELHGQGGVEPTDGALVENQGGIRSAEELRVNEVTIEEYKDLSERLRELDDKIYLVEGELIRRRADRPTRAQASDISIEMQVQDALANDPALATLRRDHALAKDRYREAERRTVKASDPARAQALQEVQRLHANYQELHGLREAELRDRLVRQMAAGGEGTGASELDRAIQQSEEELERLKDHRERLDDRLKELRVRSRDERLDSLNRDIARVDFNNAQEKLGKVEGLLAQLNYEITRNKMQISIAQRAQATYLPTSNNRMAMMAAAPVGMFALVLGLFTLLEARAARVADPEDLPGRVRVGVIGVVPPLPSSRGLLGRNSPAKMQRQVEEFVQSLDHLRVVLCASPRPGAGGGVGTGRRVVLITSACGSEGKTTLAAQLAGRCANAGLSTLLVDADLRRPRLAELLEVPDGLGLTDVLAGDAEPEAAMVVIGSAGGFHLLPAGSTGHDPSRLLQGERLGQLMAQLRATFDVVIVDAPPVLAVPDALLIGRWTDGAVLAVRHDASRFPLVERANRRLAAIGIPVLGAVVNGVRSPDAAYSSYSYNYSYSYGSDSSGPPAAPPPADDEI